MLFSVLIAHYNNAKYLDTAIASVFAQSYTDWEIILVDDGSTDEFESVISKYETDKRIKIFRNAKNMGCAFTKRKCTENASGFLAAFLDPDDSLHSDALKIMAEAHIQMPECSIIHSTHFICDDKMNIIKIATYPKALPTDTPYLLVNDGSVHHFATFKKNCYDKTVGISPKREIQKAVDQDLYYLLEEEGDIFFIDKPLYYYRIHGGSISNSGNEAITTIAHYNIVEEACLRRIKKLKNSYQPDAKYWIKKYKTRYYKISIFNSFRKKQWIRLAYSLMVFPFAGGMENLISYFKKLPKEGSALIKKSFVDNYDILNK